jgi:hypothetical protein
MTTNNLYNVIIFFDEMNDFSVMKHFEKIKKTVPKRNIAPFSPTKKSILPNINKKQIQSPIMQKKNMFPNIYKQNVYDHGSPTKQKQNSPYKIKSPTNRIIKPPYNKNIFCHNVFDLSFANEKLIKQNILTRDGIIIVLKKLNKNNHKIVIKMISDNYNKPILVLFDITNRKEYGNEFYNNICVFEKFLKNYFSKKSINIKYYFPTVSIIKDHSKSIKYININEKYEKNPIEIFVEQLLSKEVKAFTINSENYPEESLIKEFKCGHLPIRVWNHYTRLKIIYEYSKMYGYDNIVNGKSPFLFSHWKMYTKNIKQESMQNYNSIVHWAKIINNIKIKKKYRDFDMLYLKNPKIHDENYYKIIL